MLNTKSIQENAGSGRQAVTLEGIVTELDWDHLWRPLSVALNTESGHFLVDRNKCGRDLANWAQDTVIVRADSYVDKDGNRRLNVKQFRVLNSNRIREDEQGDQSDRTSTRTNRRENRTHRDLFDDDDRPFS